MHPGSVLGRFLLCFCLGVFCVLVPLAKAQDPKLSRELWTEAESFRVIGSSDFLAALQQSSTPEANAKFAELSTILWPGRPTPEAWSGFLRAALITFIAGGYEVETVLFQHPWADVVVLTGWARSAEDGRMRIVDLGITMGSVLRGAAPPYPLGRGWITEGGYAPEAIGRVNAQTTLAITGFESGNTDNPLANLTDDTILPVMAGAGFQLQEHQAALLPLLLDEAGLSRPMRFAWNEIMAAAQSGRLADILPPTAPVAAFAAIDRAFWGTLEPVSYFETDDTAAAIFASWRNPDLYIALRYRGSAEAGQITDIDLYSFSAFLNEVAQ